MEQLTAEPVVNANVELYHRQLATPLTLAYPYTAVAPVRVMPLQVMETSQALPGLAVNPETESAD